ncbi:MAG: DUF4350 domain-containing protein [Leptolyngbyaceae cyanobacterium SM1_4_3]|nr:DUF4350 domain-containing protein [Leptolyngbyaceae cyanobacterium SM1_4_3]
MIKKYRLWVGVALVLIAITLFFAPRSSRLLQGSTYGRSPNGYGAWYAYMQERGTPVQRWQRPLTELVKPRPSAPENRDVVPIRFSAADTVAQAAPTAPMTLVQVSSGVPLPLFNWDWVNQGNVLVLLGVRGTVTAAPFSSSLESPVGGVKVETSRRSLQTRSFSAPEDTEWEFEDLLRDAHGAAVWRETIGRGSVILSTTSHLAANAYQDEPGNFEFLAQLLTEIGNPIWVDEYSHGYKDEAAIAQENSENIVLYLAKTPLLLLAVQAGIMLLVLILGHRRLGPAIALETPPVDNSKAYIQAMAGVLQKANSSKFVVEMVGKAEQLNVQRSLGLGTDLLEPKVVATAWTEQTGRPAAELAEILNLVDNHAQISERELLTWLDKVQTMRRHLPNLTL